MARQFQIELELPDDLDDDRVDELSPDKKRARSARTERLIVVPHHGADNRATGLYDVHSPSGHVYTVDITESGRCQRDDGATCPDLEYNAVANCKHRKRVAIEIQENGLPKPGEDVTDYFEALDAYHQSLEQELAAKLDEARQIDRLLSRFEEIV
jgi:hypothetical protein